MAELRPQDNLLDPRFQGYNPFPGSETFTSIWNAIPTPWGVHNSIQKSVNPGAYQRRVDEGSLPPPDEYMPSPGRNPYGGAQLGQGATGIYARPRSQYQGDEVIRPTPMPMPQGQAPYMPMPSTNLNTRDYDTSRATSGNDPINRQDYPNAPGSAASYLDSWMNWGGAARQSELASFENKVPTNLPFEQDEESYKYLQNYLRSPGDWMRESGNTLNWLANDMGSALLPPRDEGPEPAWGTRRQQYSESYRDMLGDFGQRRPSNTNEYLNDAGIAAAIRQGDIVISPQQHELPFGSLPGTNTRPSIHRDERQRQDMLNREKGFVGGYDEIIRPGEALIRPR